MLEKRTFDLTELRYDTEQRKIVGHAAVFNQIAGPQSFKELVAKDSFRDSIESDDIRALWNHDPNYVLGRKSSGTLKLHEDDKGLYVEIEPPDTQWAKDLMVSINRGDVSQMSFGFQTMEEEWKKSPDGLVDVRILKKVKLRDVSPVTFPFYEGTDVALRSHEKWLEEQKKNEELKKKEEEKKERVNHVLKIHKNILGLKAKL